MEQLIINSDNLIEIPELVNGADGTAIPSATVSLTLLDLDDVEISGESWPLTMNYVSGTDATYRATAKYTLPLSHGDIVKAKVIADAGVGLRREWITPMQCITGI